MYFNVCVHCGANLDPGERCDCLEKKKNYINKFESDEEGQIQLPIGVKKNNEKEER